MNQLGIFLRKLRIDHSEVLFDMAQKLNVSSAFLSSVENNRRSAPLAWIDILTSEYNLDESQQTELTEAVSESIKQIRMDVADVSPNKKEFALAFARTFDDLSEEDVNKLMSCLGKGRI